MRGLPDFGNPLDASCYAGFDQPGSVIATPDGLALASDAAGHPRLVLEKFRGGGHGDATPQQYGLVSAWFTLAWPDQAQSRAGAQQVTAREIPDAGKLTVQLDQVDQEPLVVGEPMDWDGSLPAPWGARVTPESILWMIEAVRMRLLPLHARATLSIRGVAPRLPVKVTVDTERLLSLAPDGDPSRLTALVGELSASTGILTVTSLPNSDPPPVEQIAQRILDQLNTGSPAPSGRQQWDLTQPVVTHRQLTVNCLLRDQLADATVDEATMIPPGVDLPSLELGWQTLDVLSNMPQRRAGVLACGVNLLAPPQPPARPQAAISGCELTPEQPRQRVTLHLAPGEPLTYLSEPWMIIQGATGTREVQGRQLNRTQQRLIVSAADFGVQFAHVSADAALLALATVEVTLRQSMWTSDTVVLNRDNPDAAILIPDDGPLGSEPMLAIRVVSTASGQVIDLPEQPAAHVALGVFPVPGWGPHQLRVRNAADQPNAVELTDEAGTTTTTLMLAPAESRDWNWFAADPFRPGYRYRLRPPGEPGPWQGPGTDPELTIGAPA